MKKYFDFLEFAHMFNVENWRKQEYSGENERIR